jgi:hypothetical protein
MRLKTLLEIARETEGLTVKTEHIEEGDGYVLEDTYRTRIVDYRNLDGNVVKTPTLGVEFFHRKPQARFVDGLRTDVALDHATTIRTVKQVAKIFRLEQ